MTELSFSKKFCSDPECQISIFQTELSYEVEILTDLSHKYLSMIEK